MEIAKNWIVIPYNYEDEDDVYSGSIRVFIIRILKKTEKIVFSVSVEGEEIFFFCIQPKMGLCT